MAKKSHGIAGPSWVQILDGRDQHLTANNLNNYIRIKIGIPRSAKVGDLVKIDLNNDGVPERIITVKKRHIGRVINHKFKGSLFAVDEDQVSASVTITNKAGRISRAVKDSSDVDVVLHKPTLTITDTNEGLTTQDTISLQGSASAYSIISIYQGTTKVGETTTSNAGNWRAELSPLEAGAHNFTIQSELYSKSDSSNTIAITVVNKVIPKVVPSNHNDNFIQVLDDDGLLNLSEITNLLSSDSKLEFKITIPIATTVGETAIIIVENPAGEAGIISHTVTLQDIRNGSFIQAAPKSSLTDINGDYIDGGYELSLVIANGIGNTTSYPAKTTFILDSTPPIAPLSVEILDGGDDILEDEVLAGNVPIKLRLPELLVVGDVLHIDVNGDDIAEYTHTMTAADLAPASDFRVEIAGNLFAIDSTTNQVKATGWLVDQAGNVGESTFDTSRVLVDVKPNAATVMITEDINNDGTLNFSDIADQTIAQAAINVENLVVGNKLFIKIGTDPAAIFQLVTTITQQHINDGLVHYQVPVPLENQTLTLTTRAGSGEGKIGPTSEDSALIDTRGPILTITPELTTITEAPVNIEFSFNEAPSGFLQNDLVITGGVITHFEQVNVRLWTAIFTSDQSTAKPTITINDSRYVDLYDNNGTGSSTTLSFSPRKPDAPEITIHTDSNDNEVINNTELAGSSTVVTRISLSDDIVAGDTIRVWSTSFEGAQYRDIEEITQDDINRGEILYGVPSPIEGATIIVKANTISPFGTMSDLSNTDQALIDTQGPILDINRGDALAAGVPVYFDFSETVIGFSTDDIVIKNGSLSDFTKESNTQWSAMFNSDGSGLKSEISVQGKDFTDIHHNLGTGDVEDNLLTGVIAIDDSGNYAYRQAWGYAVLTTNLISNDLNPDGLDFSIVEIAYNGSPVAWNYGSGRSWNDGGVGTSQIKMYLGERKGSFQLEYTIQDSEGNISSADVYLWAYSVSSPLILDLNGDGVQTLSHDDGVLFDINNDGIKDKTGWVSSSDGLLVTDLNGDGEINDASELFGEETVKADGSLAKDGYDALAEQDTNLDGKISAKDEGFNTLRIWQDKNSNGLTDQGELMTLVEAGVSEISLNANVTYKEENGNITALESNYIDDQGVTRDIADVWFTYTDGASVNQDTPLTATDVDLLAPYDPMFDQEGTSQAITSGARDTQSALLLESDNTINERDTVEASLLMPNYNEQTNGPVLTTVVPSSILDLSELLDSSEGEISSLDHYLYTAQESDDSRASTNEDDGSSDVSINLETVNDGATLSNTHLANTEYPLFMENLIDNANIIVDI